MSIREFDWDPADLAKMQELDQVDYLVVHHSDSGDVSAITIDGWHRAKGYTGIGYHYVIRADGSVEKGRPDNKRGAHALNHNYHSLGIVLAGDFTNKAPETEQMDALVDLLIDLRGKFPAARVVRHKDLSSTSCPGDSFPWDEMLERLSRMDPQPGPEPAPVPAVQGTVKIKVGGVVLDGMLINDRAYAPVRALAEALGRTVEWDGATMTVTIVH